MTRIWLISTDKIEIFHKDITDSLIKALYETYNELDLGFFKNPFKPVKSASSVFYFAE